MSVHEVAREGFDAAADTYERSRPSYPPDAVAWLTSNLRIEPGARVADLAAGTGKLTTLIARLGADLIAVEPVPGMGAILRQVVPDVGLIAGTAEAIPVRDAALNAVTVAQAFHWFDADVAFAELARVLRPGGRVGLIWNARDRSEAWVDEAWGVMDRLEKHAPWRDHENWRDSALGDRGGFGPMHTAEFHHEQILSRDAVLDRFRGVSHIAVLPEDEREVVIDEVREILASHPDTAGRDTLTIPYRVDAFWCERV